MAVSVIAAIQWTPRDAAPTNLGTKSTATTRISTSRSIDVVSLARVSFAPSLLDTSPCCGLLKGALDRRGVILAPGKHMMIATLTCAACICATSPDGKGARLIARRLRKQALRALVAWNGALDSSKYLDKDPTFNTCDSGNVCLAGDGLRLGLRKVPGLKRRPKLVWGRGMARGVG